MSGLLAVGAIPATAQEVGDVTVVPIQVTGPPSKRLNLIVLCDGYQADEMQKCRDDVDSPDVTEMGAPNSLRGGKSGQCASF